MNPPTALVSPGFGMGSKRTCSADASGNGAYANLDGIFLKHALALLGPESSGGVEGHAADEGEEELDGEGAGFSAEELVGEEGVLCYSVFPDSHHGECEESHGQGGDYGGRGPGVLFAAKGEAGEGHDYAGGHEEDAGPVEFEEAADFGLAGEDATTGLGFMSASE
jgi:hypothetical protein